ncbi:MAG: 16S rRNA (guanine(527)-N(7))-methyltransferase RsmG [Actinomycetota bacterium]
MMVVERDELSEKLMEAVLKTADRIGCEISEENAKKMITYANELRKWNKAYNLVGRKVGVEGLIELIKDALTPLSVRGLLEGGKEVLDIGSGAGLPGIPLYLAVGGFPLALMEAQRKKVTFMRHICRILELDDVRVYAARMEEMVKEEDQLNAYEIGIARAVMDPSRMYRMARPLLCEGGRLVLFVGKTEAERIRRESLALEDKGYGLQTIKSTQRLVGRDNYLVVLEKTGR